MKCFSGSENWTQEWQDEMNGMGHQASLKVIDEYPEFNLIEQPLHQSGYDVITRNYDIFIETKRRDRAGIVDITKPQSEISDIISMYDENWNGFHCLTKEYNKKAKITSIYKKKKTGKYLSMTKNQFKEIATENLEELMQPLMDDRPRKVTLEEFYEL